MPYEESMFSPWEKLVKHL